MRSLAAGETNGFDGNFRSTFTILDCKNKAAYKKSTGPNGSKVELLNDDDLNM
jgi:hypothetical protein